ncbi:MAG: cytochrome c [Pseudomonadota bacterium]
MKKLIALVLAGHAGLAFSAAEPYPATDHRIAIEVTAKERNQILYEMREFLHGWHNIHHALAKNDMKAVSVEVQPMSEVMHRLPEATRERLPEGFLQMGLAMHEAFRGLGKIATESGDMQKVQEQIAEITSYCSGCHDTYRLEVTRRPRAAKN